MNCNAAQAYLSRMDKAKTNTYLLKLIGWP